VASDSATRLILRWMDEWAMYFAHCPSLAALAVIIAVRTDIAPRT